MLIKDLSDDFVSDPSASFPPGRLVTGRVKAVNVADHTVELSLRSSDVNGDGLAAQMASIVAGKVVSGIVHKVTEFGVFVCIDGSSVVGLSRVGDAVDVGVDVRKMYSVGDAVRARVLKTSGSKVSLGLRPRHFSGQGGEEGTDDEEEDEVGGRCGMGGYLLMLVCRNVWLLPLAM